MPQDDGLSSRATGLAWAFASMVTPPIGDAFLVGLSPLATSPLMIAVITLVLALVAVLKREPRFGMGEIDREARTLVVRLTVGSVLSAYSYLFALNAIGMGPSVGITAGATLVFGLGEVRTRLRTRWALVQSAVRLACVLGILLLVRPWDSDEATLAGAMLALLNAAAAFNHAVCMNRLKDKRLARAGSIRVNALSFVALVPPAFLFEGMSWLLNPDVIFRSALTGLLNGLGILMRIAAIKRLSPAVQGVAFTLRSPVASMIGAIGSKMRWLPAAHQLTWTAMAGIGIIFASALVAAGTKRPVEGDALGRR